MSPSDNPLNVTRDDMPTVERPAPNSPGIAEPSDLRLAYGHINSRGTYSFPIDRYATRILRLAA